MQEIDSIISAYESTDWSCEEAALGIVVKVEGSSYRRIGARLYVKSNGEWQGGISGGCLEGDALKQAKKAIVIKEPSLVVYDTTEDDAHQIGVGLGCNGRIEVLFIPITAHSEDNHLDYLKTIAKNREPNVLFQILEATDANVQRGTFFKDIGDIGSVTELKLSELQDLLDKTLDQKHSCIRTLENNGGAKFTILSELLLPRIRLVCVGDNYDVLAMSEVSRMLGWELELVGKPQKLSKEAYNISSKVSSLDSLKSLDVDAYTAVVLMSHDFKTDLSALQILLEHKPSYLGLLSPKKRLDKLQMEIDESSTQINLHDLPYLFGPTGLDIGSTTPQEISISIVAEIIAVIRGRQGGHLKYRSTTINDRINFG